MERDVYTKTILSIDKRKNYNILIVFLLLYIIDTKFHVGDIIYIDINGIQTRAKVVIYPTTPINIYNESLTFSRVHTFPDYDIADYKLTADGQRYSYEFLSHNLRYYLLLLSSGQTIEVEEEELVKYRTIRRSLDERKMLLMLKSQVHDNDRVRQVNPLPYSINSYIKSHFFQEPLSSRINTQVNKKRKILERESNNVGGR